MKDLKPAIEILKEDLRTVKKNKGWDKLSIANKYEEILQSLEYAIKVLENREWISVEEKPKPEVAVLVYGEDKILRGVWIPKYYMDTMDSEFTGDADYLEINDKFYWPEGWYEWNEFDEIHWSIDLNITHWMPLPELPNKTSKQ